MFNSTMRWIGIVGLAIGMCLTSCVSMPNKGGQVGVRVRMETNKGDIYLLVYTDATPVTSANFLNLVQRGYYNGTTFHRVIPGFMIQGGDPTGTGMGDPGYRFEDEIVPGLRHNAPGILSMANAGPGTNGSQFFITHAATPHLDSKHTVFGCVLSGQDVVNNIQKGDRIISMKCMDTPDDALSRQTQRIKQWNAILDSGL